MVDVTTREAKGSPLSYEEADANLTNLKAAIEALEYLGILTVDESGVASLSTQLVVNGGSANNALRVVSTDTNLFIQLADDGTTVDPQIGAQGDDFLIRTNNAERLRADGDGNIILQLPTSSAGLPSRAIWNDSGTLRIV